MKNILYAIIFFGVMSAPHAEPDLRAVPITEGSPAPWGGMLMTIDLATELGTKIETCRVKKKLEVAFQRKLCALDNSKLITLHGITERSLQAKLKATLKALERSERERLVPFYKEPTFNLLAGVIGGVTLTVTGIYALSLLQTN